MTAVGTILIVEDNTDDEELLRRAIAKGAPRANVQVARDGVEALDYLFANPAPTVVLLDLKLPRLDGMEVLRAVRANPRTQSQPIVMLTSSAEDADVAGCYALGANSYIRKPVDYTEFTATVRLLGTYWLELNRPPP